MGMNKNFIEFNLLLSIKFTFLSNLEENFYLNIHLVLFIIKFNHDLIFLKLYMSFQ